MVRFSRRGAGTRVRGFATLAALAVGLPLLLTACAAPIELPLRSRTVTLAPSSFDTQWYNDVYLSYFGPCTFLNFGAADAPAGQIMVGYINDERDVDSGPFYCYRKNDYAYRAGVVFDIRPIQALNRKVVQSATIGWRIRTALVKSGSGATRGIASGPDATNCVGKLLESTTNITKRGKFLPGIDYRGGSGDVTSLVTSWIVNGNPNYGFVLVGKDEGYSRDNAACLNTISNITLTITYLAE